MCDPLDGDARSMDLSWPDSTVHALVNGQRHDVFVWKRTDAKYARDLLLDRDLWTKAQIMMKRIGTFTGKGESSVSIKKKRGQKGERKASRNQSSFFL